MDIQPPFNNIENFFQKVLDPKKTSEKIEYCLSIVIRAEGIQNGGLDDVKFREEMNRVIVKHLGKVGSASLEYQIKNVNPFDGEVSLILPTIKGELFLKFWSAMAFQSYYKLSIKELNFQQLKKE